MGPFSDRLAQLVSGERDPSAPLPTYVTSSTAIAANGLLSRALANGGDRRGATRIGGVPTMFLVDTTGPHGGCRWTTEFADIGELERAESALMADASWVALIDRVALPRALEIAVLRGRVRAPPVPYFPWWCQRHHALPDRTSVTRTGTPPAGALAATPVAAMCRFSGSRAVRCTRRTTATLISNLASPNPMQRR
jgi:hypothetical protein